MRIRLTDGTRVVDVRTPDTTPLPDAEGVALRLYAALTEGSEQAEQRAPFGFGMHLDGTALDSNIERAEQRDESDLDDDEVSHDAEPMGRQQQT